MKKLKDTAKRFLPKFVIVRAKKIEKHGCYIQMVSCNYIVFGVGCRFPLLRVRIA